MSIVNCIKHYRIYASENNQPNQFTAVINTKNNMIMTAQITRCQNGNSSIVLNSNGPTAYYCIDLGKYFNNIDLNFDAKIGEFVINACDSGVEYTMFLDKKYHTYKDMITAFNKESDGDNNSIDVNPPDTNTDTNNVEGVSTLNLLKNGVFHKFDYCDTYSTSVYDSSGNAIGTLMLNWKIAPFWDNYELTVKLYFTKSNETNVIKFYMSSKELIKYLPFDKCNKTFDYVDNTLIGIKIYPVDTATIVENKSNEFSASISEIDNIKCGSNIKGIQICLMK